MLSILEVVGPGGGLSLCIWLRQNGESQSSVLAGNRGNSSIQVAAVALIPPMWGCCGVTGSKITAIFVQDWILNFVTDFFILFLFNVSNYSVLFVPILNHSAFPKIWVVFLVTVALVSFLNCPFKDYICMCILYFTYTRPPPQPHLLDFKSWVCC
jgi:hypothetical protein